MVWLIVATLAASFIKGVCGFANTLVFTTILSFSFNNIQITPMDLIIGYPANVIIAWKERRQINWRISLPVAALIIFGNIPGIFMLKNVDTRTIKVIFGFFIIAMGIEMLMREMEKAETRNHAWTGWCAFQVCLRNMCRCTAGGVHGSCD